MERLTLEVSTKGTEISSRINEFYPQFEKISSRADEAVAIAHLFKLKK